MGNKQHDWLGLHCRKLKQIRIDFSFISNSLEFQYTGLVLQLMMMVEPAFCPIPSLLENDQPDSCERQNQLQKNKKQKNNWSVMKVHLGGKKKNTHLVSKYKVPISWREWINEWRMSEINFLWVSEIVGTQNQYFCVFAAKCKIGC